MYSLSEHQTPTLSSSGTSLRPRDHSADATPEPLPSCRVQRWQGGKSHLGSPAQHWSTWDGAAWCSAHTITWVESWIMMLDQTSWSLGDTGQKSHPTLRSKVQSPPPRAAVNQGNERPTLCPQAFVCDFLHWGCVQRAAFRRDLLSPPASLSTEHHTLVTRCDRNLLSLVAPSCSAVFVPLAVGVRSFY